MEIKSSKNLKVDSTDRMEKFYQSFENPALEKVVVDLSEESPKLAKQICSLSTAKSIQFQQAVSDQISALEPEVKKALLRDSSTNELLKGSAIGGGLGISSAGIALSFSEISKSINNPVLFALSVTALGAITGALSKKVFSTFTEPAQPGTTRGLKVNFSSPTWTKTLIGEFGVEMNLSSDGGSIKDSDS